jgi:putative transposase
MLTFQYRLYPTKSQQQKLWQHANKLNWLYNYFLNQKIEAYKTEKKSISKNTQQGELVKLKETDPILAEIHSQVLQQVAIRLDRSYQSFFRTVKSNKTAGGFPKFRSCKDFFGICYPQSGFVIIDGLFKTKVYGDMSFVQHRDLKGQIKQVSISNKNNKFYINITTDHIKATKASGSIGIDIGLKHLVVATDGLKIKNRTDSKYFDKQIAKVQSRKDQVVKGSRKYKFLKKVANRLYGAKVRKINDFQHKVSKRLGSTYDTIYAEDLSVKSMSEGKWTNLNRSIRNAKLAQFLSFLGYKTNHLVLVNPRNTSKTCNKCSKIHIDLKLSDRTITCSCGNIYDRDENAAQNVFCLGQAMQENPAYVGSMTIQEALAFRR